MTKRAPATADALRLRLLEAQGKLLEEARRPLIVLLCGTAGAGKSEVAGRLMEWMDPRHVRAAAFDAGGGNRTAFWSAMPAKGKAAIFSVLGTRISI
jgi:AMP-polyphosphate phosphotransferase